MGRKKHNNPKKNNQYSLGFHKIDQQVLDDWAKQISYEIDKEIIEMLLNKTKPND